MPESLKSRNTHVSLSSTPAQITSAGLLQFLDISPDALVIVNEAGTIVIVNGQAEALFGYSHEELLNQPLEILLPPRFRKAHIAHREHYFSAPLTRPMGAGLQLFGRRKDGAEFPVDIFLRPLLLDDVPHAISAIRDVTEQKVLEEQLQRKNEELEEQFHRVQEANRLKSEFLASMSHELRTPLNGIIGFAELMFDGIVGEVSEEQKEYLGDILSSSRHLLKLINDVLDLGKVEAGKMLFHPESVDPAKLVGEVTDILRPLAVDKRIQVESEIDEALNPLMIDPSRFKQVLYNYLSNAIKFTPEGGQVAIRIRSQEDEAFLLEVEDTGPGIAVQDMDRLFIEFQQLEVNMTKKHQGTGLGLALTRRIVEAQGGQVGVSSTPGKGSTFFAILPCVSKLIREGDEQDEQAEKAILSLQSHPARVLVVEDNARDREWLVRTLTSLECTVEAVGTAAEAIARCQQVVYDFITLDLLLPDLGGWEVLKTMRNGRLNANTPVVVITVVSEKGFLSGLPIHDMLSKPIVLGDLLASLKRLGIAVPTAASSKH